MRLDYITKEQAEKMSEIKLDGRGNYFIWEGLVCTNVKYTTACSGCFDDIEYCSGTQGAGCDECGYTGKRRNSFPAPANPKQVKWEIK